MKSLLGRFGAMALACGFAAPIGAALAQNGQRLAAPPQATGPIKLDLLPMQSPWTKICGTDQGNNKQVCYTTRDFGQAVDKPPTLAVAIYQMQGEENRIARFLLPVALMLKPGFRLILDKGEPIPGEFAICFPNGCFAETKLNGASLAALKRAQTATIQVRNQGNAEVNFIVPMKDFAAAFDGPAIDPKVLARQNEQLQKQLEEKARLQREELEKQNAQSAPQAQPQPQATSKPPK